MARRPVFLPDPEGASQVRTCHVDFQWHAGLSVLQKQKSISALHNAARAALGVERTLEISSKSADRLGVALSAFNLTFKVPQLPRTISVECAFQGSKVFEKGGPYIDIFLLRSRDAKRDERLISSGRLQKFRFLDQNWALEPRTAFYDWLYISALMARPDLAAQLDAYDAFTDIEFNPEKSINCQAYSVALYESLRRSRRLEEAFATPDAFLQVLSTRKIMNAIQDDTAQGRLF